MEMTHPSAVCVVSFQLQHPKRAKRMFAPLTNTARSLPANAFSANRKTSIFNIPLLTRPNRKSTIFLKAV